MRTPNFHYTLSGFFYILQFPFNFASIAGNSTESAEPNTTYAPPVKSVRVQIDPEHSLNNIRRSLHQNDRPQIFVPPYFSSSLLDGHIRHGMSRKRNKVGNPLAGNSAQQVDAQGAESDVQGPADFRQQAAQFQPNPSERDVTYPHLGYPMFGALGAPPPPPPPPPPETFGPMQSLPHPFAWGAQYSNATSGQSAATLPDTGTAKAGRSWQPHNSWATGNFRPRTSQGNPNGLWRTYWQSQGAMPPPMSHQTNYHNPAQIDPFLLSYFPRIPASQMNPLNFQQNLRFPEMPKNPSGNEQYGRTNAEALTSRVNPSVGMFFEKSPASNIPVSANSPFNSFQPKVPVKPSTPNKHPSVKSPPAGYPMFSSYRIPEVPAPPPTTTPRPASASPTFILRAQLPPTDVQYKGPFDAPLVQPSFEQNFLGQQVPSPNARVTYSMNPSPVAEVPDHSMGKDRGGVISLYPQQQGGIAYTGGPGSFQNVSSQFQLEQSPINYCNTMEFDDQILATINLKRMDYFVVNMSCSNMFYQCATRNTFVRRCPGPDQVFDHFTLNCNYRYNVKGCMEYDHVLHCTVKSQCLAEEYACCAVPQQCISYARRCDGVLDCADGEDENNCPTCSINEFPCLIGGTCIPMERRCNGMPDDCFDGSNADEKYCDVCGSGRYFCYKSDAQYELGCIEASQRCDGVKDCQGGEDELNCKRQGAQFLLCENQRQSVPRKQWCDGNEDCADGSDEAYCEY